MIVFVCGGRDYPEKKVTEKLDELFQFELPWCVIHGDARGADRGASNWAEERGIQEIRCPANWAFHKKSAGPVRNHNMFKLLSWLSYDTDVNGEPTIAVVFPGGKGTAHMKSLLEKHGSIEIIEVSPEDNF